ncbi:MAG TPA: multicopper oxidase domain-containing protein [Candidatus Acidoferrales bacterium]|nr:multicopper oxidase domain-containing protein [Candidatus Acidoferrales bacterium]
MDFSSPWPSKIAKWVALGTALIASATPAFAQQPAPAPACSRPAAGSTVAEPEDLRSHNGVLSVEIIYRKSVDANGAAHYCYIAPDGSEAPTLRVKPGDLLILRLKNEIPADPPRSLQSSSPAAISPLPVPHLAKAGRHQGSMAGDCAGSEMTAAATNIHFHGLDVPPVCHQDDVLNTMIEPGAQPFEYRFRVPADEPPGLYWYHPHIHGFTKAQVLGGASGALIVEGIEHANTLLAGMPERVFVIRDQDLEHPDAQAISSANVPAPVVTLDAEGDILNAGMDGGKPAKDLSINFVPVSFPEYKPAVIRVKPAEKQLWRVLNASAITYLDLEFKANKTAQMMGVVSMDGNPINENGLSGNRILWESHILLPPGGRVEFVRKGIPEGTTASFVTRVVDTGPAGENDPTRTLATIVAANDAPETNARLDTSPGPRPKPVSVWLGDAAPVRTRTLYFSEAPRNPTDPNSLTDFYITVDGQTPKLFDPNDKTPNIIAKEGEVEDWIIENRTRELHAFHIHQIHFMLLEWNRVPVDEPFLRDTINVSYWDGVSKAYPSVKLRMDFRDPNVVGTFVYHCHLLEHEDGGMMGLIRVDAATGTANSQPRLSAANRRLCGNPAAVASIRSRSQHAVTFSPTNINENDSRAIARAKAAQNSF